ncbi:MAG: membrane dipeptidase [Planctomycetota bacterium]|jgi:membrane dipeptidase
MVKPFVFDAHVDSLQIALELGVDLGEGSPGQLDLPRGRAGGLGAVVLTSWVEPRYIGEGRGGARARADSLFNCLDALVAGSPRETLKILTKSDLDRARASERLAAIAGIEGGHPLESSQGAEDWMEGLEHFFNRGLRVLTLVWNNHLTWVRSCDADPSGKAPAGLTDLGKRLVGRMNELGILVDLSHAAPRSFFDAIEASSKPVIASHSGCKALHDHQRNLSDEQLRALRDNGGVVGVPFLPSFLDAEAQRESARARAQAGYRELQGKSATELEIARTHFMARELEPLSIERLADHIEHVVEVAGIDHIGLGSDFDGITTTVAGLHDASSYPNLEAPLRARGFGDSDVQKVFGLNMLRVLREALPGDRE